MVNKNNNRFFNLCIPDYLCNNCKLFISTKIKSIDFMLAASQVIQTKEVIIISIFLLTRRIKLNNINLFPDCNLKLILLNQLREKRTTYHNNSKLMILMKNGKLIANAKKEQNLFTFKLI